MTPPDALRLAGLRGLTLRVADGHIDADCPAAAMDDAALLAEIRSAKPALLAWCAGIPQHQAAALLVLAAGRQQAQRAAPTAEMRESACRLLADAADILADAVATGELVQVARAIEWPALLVATIERRFAEARTARRSA